MTIRPVIILSTARDIVPTHDVRYTTRYQGLIGSESRVKISSIRFRSKMGHPSRELAERRLRAQLGIDRLVKVFIVSITPFAGYVRA
ncbi:MAG: hypothetical protein UY70_C0016G0028 [Candidatus Kaiserbacteria bacterium GW2011_GWB1_52_6]|uniref:Uncharacterized protein n=3 Tax=Candidatus Kaiseribacteriota TaxID=1752734 RepID=A0A0G1XK50_9BACT|nr:MAG: hypothetical protein UY67_C0008G0022 [Candidatus Kaiserbacteria bacterium GW2011_GWA2_52_12]KKW27344.1 MAG: hypothetical protein UY70_C0016G0028 [Candidatus Kaiserbacteria bacterium GW2011_GWB1_52_6]KKW31598.1 MAG: hypothetical protein UY74_C0010G0011 [Candidatus Kaiserbacteria bacterium GW2011_GWC2_52_8b]